ncbi:MAG TPA: SDR family oxidoreductase [Bacilli bacterium]|nr:SDR family oxidoreductase [Bacilli bacterium]
MSKVVLVTGSSIGIGKATIIEFASHGYNVVINYLTNEEKANELKKYVEDNYNVKALCIKCDVSNEYDVLNMISEIESEFGKVDVLINNAAIAIDTTFEDKTPDNFMKTLNVNLVGPFIVSKHAKNIMNRGSIINVASTNGIDTYYPYSMDYDASKAGLILLTHNLAIEFSPNVRVNAVAPGWVSTDMNRELDPEYIKAEQKKILLGRFAEPEEIAKVIYFLASDEAKYINNEIIRIDGGFNA